MKRIIMLKNKSFAPYKVGDNVFGLDKEKNIVHACHGVIKSVHTKDDGTPLYNVEFDHGTFLLGQYQLTTNLDDLD
jgi:hypothetical protein|tara:strand:- start:8289 stop:8516 length:228 start_codon:yes stop_codon:yes gene_type:complete